MIMFDDKLISTSTNEIKVLLLLRHLNQTVTSTSNPMGARKNHRCNTQHSTMRIFDGFHALVCGQVPPLNKRRNRGCEKEEESRKKLNGNVESVSSHATLEISQPPSLKEGEKKKEKKTRMEENRKESQRKP
jgi:hypothetical protein